jgi:hypothetical protein
VLRSLAQLRPIRVTVGDEQQLYPEEVERMIGQSAVGGLLARIDAFLSHGDAARNRGRQRPKSILADRLAGAGFEREIPALRQWAGEILEGLRTKLAEPGKVELWKSIHDMLGETSNIEQSEPDGPSALEALNHILTHESQRLLNKLLIQVLRGDATFESGLCGELLSLTVPFQGANGLALKNEPHSTSFEAAIDEGKILIVDFPLTGGGGADRTALYAAQIAFMASALARSHLARNSNPINRTRPVVLVLDEFHAMLSTGRHSGLGRFLSQCREFGVITVMGCQNLRLVAEALGDHNQFEALVNGIGSRFFGRNHDLLTNERASAICRYATPDRQPLGLGFADDPDVEEMLLDSTSVSESRIPPSRFSELQTGEFIAQFADGTMTEMKLPAG